MAYNNINHYKNVIAVVEVYDAYSKEGLSNIEIYRRYIKNIFFISKSTFDNYLKKSEEAKIAISELS